jgi:hypothetical protein
MLKKSKKATHLRENGSKSLRFKTSLFQKEEGGSA